MDFITCEQTEEALCRIEHECEATEDSRGIIDVTTENWKDLLWLAENTTYCRKDISNLAYNCYCYGRNPYRDKSYHRRIQYALLETGLTTYRIEWEEDLIAYALDVGEVDIHSFKYRSLDRVMERLSFLLSRGFNIDIHDTRGNTFLHRIAGAYVKACTPKNVLHPLLDQILPHQPEPFLRNFNGETPLDLARRLNDHLYERLLAYSQEYVS